MNLSEFLKKFREKRMMTQEEMAKGIGISRTYYATLETGWFNKTRNKPTSLGLQTIRSIAFFTGKTPDYIRKLINKKG